MKIADARYETDCLLDSTFTINGKDYCLRDLGWSFKWMNSKRTLGQCRPRQKLVLLSEHYVFNNVYELVKDTILHELAHAFDWEIYKNAGHGRTWKNICVQVGAKPQRCKSISDGIKSDYNYLVRHKKTHEIFGGYHRLTSKTVNSMSRKYVPGRKAETLGNLEIVSASEVEPNF